MWSKLEAQCSHRSHCIEEFRASLEAIEILRSEAVGEELRRLVDEMVSIACRMPDEIERLAEVSTGQKKRSGRCNEKLQQPHSASEHCKYVIVAKWLFVVAVRSMVRPRKISHASSNLVATRPHIDPTRNMCRNSMECSSAIA